MLWVEGSIQESDCRRVPQYPQPQMNWLHVFVSQLAMQHAVCYQLLQTTSSSKQTYNANPNFNLRKNFSLVNSISAWLQLLQAVEFFKPCYSLDFVRHDTENKTQMKPAVKGFKRFKNKNKMFKRCYRSTTEVWTMEHQRVSKRVRTFGIHQQPLVKKLPCYMYLY